MSKDLTISLRDRQNILNNRYALKQVEKHLAWTGTFFYGELVFTKQQVIELFGISDATIERYLSLHDNELKANGYQLLRGAKLKKFKELAFGTLINEGSKTTVLGVFSFRAVLNLGMLLTESEPARKSSRAYSKRYVLSRHGTQIDSPRVLYKQRPCVS